MLYQLQMEVRNVLNLFRKTEKMVVPAIKHPPIGSVRKPVVRETPLEFPSHLVPLTAASFKHVYDALPLFWGTSQFHEYMRKLLINDRSDARQGFPPAVLSELYRLTKWHDVVFPKLVELGANAKVNPWSHTAGLEWR